MARRVLDGGRRIFVSLTPIFFPEFDLIIVADLRSEADLTNDHADDDHRGECNPKHGRHPTHRQCCDAISTFCASHYRQQMLISSYGLRTAMTTLLQNKKAVMGPRVTQNVLTPEVTFI